MLLRSWAPVVFVLVRLVKADDDDGFSELSSCGQDCVNNMRTSTGCVPVTDECLCTSQDFIYGITDCANAACTSSDAQAALDWADSWCASVTASTSSAAATSTAEATSTSEASTTTSETPATTDAATTSAAAEAAQTTASDSDTSTTAAATTSATSTSSTDAAASTSATTDSSSTDAGAGAGAATQSSSSTTASSAADSSTTSASSSSSSSSSSDDSTTSSGLSAGAKAGIVVGAAGAAICVVAAVLYLSRKRKKPLPRGTMKISEPLPGSGRIGDDVWERYHSPPPFSPMYSSQQQPPRTAGSNYTELDRHAKPYENMVPRMTPTRMV